MEPPGRASTCIRCGYDLAGLPDSGACPECAGSISDSRRLCLQLSPPGFLHGLRAAAALAFISLPLVGVYFAISIVWMWSWISTRGVVFPLEPVLQWTPVVVSLLTDLLWLIAVWLATAPNGCIDGRAGPRRVRRATRWLLVILTVIVVLYWAIPSLAWLTLWFSMHAGFALYHILVPVHLLNLAQRSGDPAVVRRAARAARLVPLLAVPAMFVLAVSRVFDVGPALNWNSTASTVLWAAWRLTPDAAMVAVTVVMWAVLRGVARTATARPATAPPGTS